MPSRPTRRRARRTQKANACTSFCRDEYLPEVRRTRQRLLDRINANAKRKNPKMAGVFSMPTPTTRQVATQMRQCKRLYCNPGCPGFPFSKKTRGRGARTPHFNKDDIDYYDGNDSVYRKGRGAGPTYWKAPIADFDDRYNIETVIKLKRKGATTMCARETNAYGPTNPDWLYRIKMDRPKAAAVNARATSPR